MQVGHHLQITAGHKNLKTFLKDSYCRQPFKIADITEHKTGRDLRLMIRSSSPGILDQDHYHAAITVEENASLHLSTQAYQRIYTMKGDASQKMEFTLENRASLVYLPHPVVPHRNSHYRCQNNIHLREHHHLIWSEILTSGRKLSGESFEFTCYSNTTQIFLNGSLVVRETVHLSPGEYPLHHMGQMENFTHQSTLLFINDRANVKEVARACLQYLSLQKEILSGITSLPVPGILVRMLGNGAESLFECNQALSALIEGIVTPT